MRNVKDYVRQLKFKIILENNIIYIEDYTDIGDIKESEILIYNNKQKILIKGNKLQIKKLTKNEILILGKYDNIIFQGINE